MAAPGRKKGPAPKPKQAVRRPAGPAAPSAPVEAPPLPRNALGVIGLGLGVLAVLGSPLIVWGVLLGVPAAVCGFLSLKRVRRGEATCFRSSVSAIVLGVIAIAIAIALIVYGRHVLDSPAGKRYTECLDRAGGDRAAREVCEDAFDRER